MIDQLMQSFAAQAKSTAAATIAPAEVVPVSGDPTCGKCGGSHHWKTRSNDRWFCVACQPPAVPSMIAAERGKPPESASDSIVSFIVSDSRSVVARYHYAVGQRCQTCRGRLIRETCWSDFSADVTCWTCGDNRNGLCYGH